MKGAAKMKENKTIKIITMITGILTVLLGFYAVVRPMRTFLAIGWILGMLLFVNGIELVILSLSKEKKDIGGCILGVLEGLGGIILLFSGVQRFLTDIMATYLVGASILVYGIFQIVTGVKKSNFSNCLWCVIHYCKYYSLYSSGIDYVLSWIYDRICCFNAGNQYDRTCCEFWKRE